MKDRLRVRQIKYDHERTAGLLLGLIEGRPGDFERCFTFHPLFSGEIVKELVRVFIGEKQMSIRRFTSVLKLVD